MTSKFKNVSKQLNESIIKMNVFKEDTNKLLKPGIMSHAYNSRTVES